MAGGAPAAQNEDMSEATSSQPKSPFWTWGLLVAGQAFCYVVLLVIIWVVGWLDYGGDQPTPPDAGQKFVGHVVAAGLLAITAAAGIGAAAWRKRRRGLAISEFAVCSAIAAMTTLTATSAITQQNNALNTTMTGAEAESENLAYLHAAYAAVTPPLAAPSDQGSTTIGCEEDTAGVNVSHLWYLPRLTGSRARQAGRQIIAYWQRKGYTVNVYHGNDGQFSYAQATTGDGFLLELNSGSAGQLTIDDSSPCIAASNAAPARTPSSIPSASTGLNTAAQARAGSQEVRYIKATFAAVTPQLATWPDGAAVVISCPDNPARWQVAEKWQTGYLSASRRRQVAAEVLSFWRQERYAPHASNDQGGVWDTARSRDGHRFVLESSTGNSGPLYLSVFSPCM